MLKITLTLLCSYLEVQNTICLQNVLAWLDYKKKQPVGNLLFKVIAQEKSGKTTKARLKLLYYETDGCWDFSMVLHRLRI